MLLWCSMMSFFFLSLFCCHLCLSSHPGPSSTRPVVRTDCGLVEGVLVGRHYEFLGIPFAQPPVDKLRWNAPQPLVPSATYSGQCWPDRVYNATYARSVCVQVEAFTGKATGSEDCLYLEVHVPNSTNLEESGSTTAGKKPVFFWIHGGALAMGTGAFNMMYGSPRTFAEEQRVVVVSINYRLGALGFLALKELENDKTKVSGNYGLLDAIAGLKWVQSNIGQFGGDANRVTIVGQSAGAELVLALVTSPLAFDLFQRAMSMSGLPGLTGTLDQAYQINYDHLVASSPCANVSRGDSLRECLYSVSGPEWGLTFARNPLYGPQLMGPPTVDSPRSLPMLVVDGWSFPAAFPDAFVSGFVNEGVDFVVGSEQEEVDLMPTMHVMNYTQLEYEAFVESNFDAFSKGLGDQVLELYPLSQFDSPQQAYDNIATDIVMTCPNLQIAALASKRMKNVYAYIASQKPEFPLCWAGPNVYCSQYSFHMFDVLSAFWNSPQFVPHMADEDRLYGETVRDVMTAFFVDGSFEEWPRFGSGDEAVLMWETEPVVVRNPRSKVCKFWEANDFSPQDAWGC